jgi:N-acetyl sugar amidotransferase
MIPQKAVAVRERIVSDPMLLKRCSRCVMPETQEIISFDAQGVCSTCRNVEIKQQKIDWNQKHRDFDQLLEQYRGKSTYDCIVPFSGGKDSTFTAYSLIRDWGLKPLIVSFDHHLMRPRVLENRERTLRKLGADFIGFRPDWQLVKKMMRISLERKGDILWYQHSGIFAYPMKMAVKLNVPLVIWGEPSAEYTSYYDYDQEEEVDETRFNMFVNLGITAEDMLGMLNEPTSPVRGEQPVTMRDMDPYIYPSRSELQTIKCRSICLGSFVPWDVKEHVKIIQRELGWQGDLVEGVPPEYSYEKIEDMMQGVQDYLKFIKRGYGRMSHLASIDIRNGRLTRPEAMEAIGTWEGLRPASLDVLLEWLSISEEQFYAIADRLRVAPWKHDPKTTRRGPPLPDQKFWVTD